MIIRTRQRARCMRSRRRLQFLLALALLVAQMPDELSVFEPISYCLERGFRFFLHSQLVLMAKFDQISRPLAKITMSPPWL